MKNIKANEDRKVITRYVSPRMQLKHLWIKQDGSVTELKGCNQHEYDAEDKLKKVTGKTITIGASIAWQTYSGDIRCTIAGDSIQFDIVQTQKITSKQIKTMRSLVEEGDHSSAYISVSTKNGENYAFSELGDPEDVFKTALNYFRRKKMIKESIIDYPLEELDPVIWDKEGDSYKLKGEVKEKIYTVLREYKSVNLEDIAEEIHITGSSGTNQYASDADVDVHIIPKEGVEITEDVQKDVFRWFKKNRDSIKGYVDSHPIEVYVQLNPAQEYLSDAVYDIVKDEWLKGPTVVSLEFDPYEEFEPIMSDIEAEAGEADKLIGELHRDTIDYDIIKKAVKRLPVELKKKLLIRLRNKKEEVEEDIRSLMSLKQSWTDKRKMSSQPETIEQALKDVEMAKTWRSKNAIFKYLNRYDYMRLITDLEAMLKDEELSQEELSTIQQMV